MQVTPDVLFERLKSLRIETQTHSHPAVFTVDDAKKHCSHLAGSHCKNLFLKDKKGVLFLIVATNTQLINLKHLRKQIGSNHLSFGKPDLLRKILGVEPGSVSPFALINDTKRCIEVILDKEMMQRSLLNFHPLTNCLTTSITPTDLLVFIQNTGHSPALVKL
jgi:Ala-tRNA(Pro) deacylase